MFTLESSQRDGGKPSFESFYQKYYPQVFGYLMKKIGRYHDAEDLTSDIFAYCYQHYDAYDPCKSAIGTWLYVIVNSRFKNYCRDRRVTVDYETLENVIGDSGSDMENSVVLSERRDALAAGLKRLPEKYRTAVILRYFFDRSFEQIAERLGTTPGNARVILSRAMDKLERELGNS